MTLLGWMVYAVLATLLLGGAAWILERALLPLGRPVRWVWALALAAAVALPLAALSGIGTSSGPTGTGIAPAPVGERTLTVPPAVGLRGGETLLGPLQAMGSELTGAAGRVAATVPGPGPSDRAVGLFWLGGALTLTFLLLGASLRLSRRARGWPQVRLHGERVRIAPDTGPAVVGIARPWIVLPRWALGMGPQSLGLILLHEREHISARDTLLLAVASGLTLSCFWNPGLWWMLQRLGGAMEMDCDRRVLSRGVSRAEYGALLVDVGSGYGGLPLHAAAMAEPSNLLERRLRQMRPSNVRHPILALAAAGMAAALLLAVACETEAPTPPATQDDPVEIPAEEGQVVLDLPGVIPPNAWEVDAPPLFIIDGVILSADRIQLEIEPDHIQSIEIVKGAKAQELYGDRARHGVIFITTVDAPPPPESPGTEPVPFTKPPPPGTSPEAPLPNPGEGL